MYAVQASPKLKGQQALINHIALVLDMSGSMARHATAMIKAVDSLTEHLAVRSLELNQETRITVYTFDDYVEAVYYDKDVLRLPSIAQHYVPRGMTALIDATLKSQDDLAKTAQIYGDHAFLTYVFTDGLENVSRNPAMVLKDVLGRQGDNWTVAALVPDEAARIKTAQYGFQAGNIATWNAKTAEGFQAATQAIRDSADTFMTTRSKGVRSTKNLFGGVDKVNKQTVEALGLTPLSTRNYSVVPVAPGQADWEIQDFVKAANSGSFQVGQAYYLLDRGYRVQGNKHVAVMEKKTNRLFIGDKVRDLLGLPDHEVTVNPADNPDYAIYVQSTSLNRKVRLGQNILLLKG